MRKWKENEEIERENGKRMRKWRWDGKKEKTWRGSKSLSLSISPPLSISPFSLYFLSVSIFSFPHYLTISFPFSRLLSICSTFSHFLAIFSEAASQLPSTCAGLPDAAYPLHYPPFSNKCNVFLELLSAFIICILMIRLSGFHDMKTTR